MEALLLAFRAHFKLATVASHDPTIIRGLKRAKEVLIGQFKDSPDYNEQGRRFYAFLRSSANPASDKIHPALGVLYQVNTGELTFLQHVAAYCVRMVVTGRGHDLLDKHGSDRFVTMWMDTYDLLFRSVIEARVESRRSLYERLAGPGNMGVQMMCALNVSAV